MELKLSNPKIKNTYYAIPSKSVYIRALILASFLNEKTHLIGKPLSDDICTCINALKELGANIFEVDDGVIVESIKEVDCKKMLDMRDSAMCYRFFREIVDNPLVSSSRLNERVKSNVTSQSVSGKLLRNAIYNLDEEIDMDNENVRSKGYIDLTKKVIEDFKSHPKEYKVEGDFSSASIFLALGAIKGEVRVKGLNANSIQPDQNILNVLKDFGAEVFITQDEIRVKHKSLSQVIVDGSLFPDLVPVISLIGCYSTGETRIQNISYLKYKESNRLESITSCLKNLGGNVRCTDDEIIVNYSPLKGGIIDSYNDHRIVMLGGISSLITNEDIIIKNYECISKSYPNFFDNFR